MHHASKNKHTNTNREAIQRCQTKHQLYDLDHKPRPSFTQRCHYFIISATFLPHLDVFTGVGMALTLTPNFSSSFLKPMRDLRISCVACQMLTVIFNQVAKTHQLTEQAGCKFN